MANTSSFALIHKKTNVETIRKNVECYNSFENSVLYKPLYVILEYEKFNNKEKVLKYLDILKDLCSIEKVIDNSEKEQLEIYPIKKLSKVRLIFLGMCVRFIYEGQYKSDDWDLNFYKIFESFMFLMEHDLFKNEDVLEVLLFCHNITLHHETNSKENENHCFLNCSYSPYAIKEPVLIKTEEFNKRITQNDCISGGVFYYKKFKHKLFKCLEVDKEPIEKLHTEFLLMKENVE